VKAVAAPLPLTSLADVRALDQTLKRVEGPIVVAGNADAGAVIASTRDEQVASRVYVAARSVVRSPGTLYPKPRMNLASSDIFLDAWTRVGSGGLSKAAPFRALDTTGSARLDLGLATRR
jgi:hypothetical protein